MARPRSELSAILNGIEGVQTVAFQPDGTTTLKDPAIMYEPAKPFVQHADNVKYKTEKGYLVTVIDRDPDSPIADAVEALPFTTFDRGFRANGLNHFVFNLYF